MKVGKLVSAAAEPFGARKTVPASVVYTPFVTVEALPETLPAIVLVKVWVPPQVLAVEVPKPREMVFPDRDTGYVKVRGDSYVPKSDTCDLVIKRFASVVRPGRVVVAESRVSKRLPKVVVYTPLVTVPAFPLTEPVMVLLKMLVPLNVLVSARRVVEATVMFAEPLKETPLMVLAVVRVAAEPVVF